MHDDDDDDDDNCTGPAQLLMKVETVTEWRCFYASSEGQCEIGSTNAHKRHQLTTLVTEADFDWLKVALNQSELSCRKFCSKLLQWMLRFVAKGSLSVVLLESHLEFRFVPNHKKCTSYVALFANRPEKCLVLRNFSEVVIRRCHKMHPSLRKYLTDHQTWTKSRIGPRVLDLWTTLQVSRSLGPPSMTLEHCRNRRVHSLFGTILSSECLQWNKNLLGWFDCGRASMVLLQYQTDWMWTMHLWCFWLLRPRHYKQRDLRISS